MKKFILLILLTLMLVPINCFAKDSSINLSTSSSSFTEGSTITVNVTIKSDVPIGYYEYTLDFDNNSLKLLNSNSYVVNRTNDSSTKKVNNTFKFKILKNNNSKISVSSYSIVSAKDEKNLSVEVNPLTLSSSNKTKSKDIYLKSLEVENYELNPKFDKKITNYTISIDKDIKKININAEAPDKNYSINGDGQYDLKGKDDSFDITVKDNNGNSKTYTIKVKINKGKEITIKIDDKKYLLISDSNSYKEIPTGFETKLITIDDNDINALYNENTKQTLVVLKDEDGNLELFLYDEEDNSYSKYEVLTFEKISIIPTNTDKTIKGYDKDKIKINEKDINCLRMSPNSRFVLIYGMNAEDGTKDFYSYDTENKTIQAYNDEIDSFYKNKEKSTKFLIIILAATSIFFGLLVIALAIKLSHKK